jgi:hypothetical protein
MTATRRLGVILAVATQQSGEIGALQDATWSNPGFSHRPAVLQLHELVEGHTRQREADWRAT